MAAPKSVSDVMRSGVVGVSRSTPLDSVARAMREHGVHGVLVAGDNGEPLGWVTARGLLRHPAAEWHHVQAGQAITEPPVLVVPSAGIGFAIDAMLDGDVTHLAVMRPGAHTPDGVVSDIDLVAHLTR